MRYARLSIIAIMTIVGSLEGALSQGALRPQVAAFADSIAGQQWLKEYAHYPVLDDTASVGELTTLSGSAKAAVRYYALRALASKNDSTVLAVLTHNLSDTAHVVVGGGDVYGQGPLSWYVANKFLARYLRQSSLSDHNYAQIRVLAQDTTVPAAVMGLARYQNSEDVPLLQKRIHQMLFLQPVPPGGQPDYAYFALLSIREFPHPQFFSLLQKARTLKRDERTLLQAVVVYKNQEAHNFVQDYLRQSQGDDLWMAKMNVAVALIRYPIDRFHQIERELTLDLSSFKMAQQWAQDPD